MDGAAFAGTPLSVSGGRAVYGRGETIEVTLRFDRDVTVDSTGGTPSVTLTVGAAQRTAEYRRGTGSRQLVFGYTVASGDSDSNGVDLVANSLALNGGSIVAKSDGGTAALGHAALAGGDNRGVNGSVTPGTAGICGRTPAVQAAILARVQANDATVATCTQVIASHLSAVTGTLDVSAQVSTHGRMAALKAGDFAGLTGVTALDLDNHAIRVFPAGIFDTLTSLTELSIAYNQTPGGEPSDDPAGRAVRPADEAHRATPGAKRPGDAAGSDLRETDEPHDADLQRQSGQRVLPAGRSGGARGRLRREGRRYGDPGGRCGRPLGQQSRLFVEQGLGHDSGPVGDGRREDDRDRAGARRGGGAGIRADRDRRQKRP